VFTLLRLLGNLARLIGVGLGRRELPLPMPWSDWRP
jgi:hypothetical protein